MHVSNADDAETAEREFSFTSQYCRAIRNSMEIIMVEMVVGDKHDVCLQFWKGLWKPVPILGVSEGVRRRSRTALRLPQEGTAKVISQACRHTGLRLPKKRFAQVGSIHQFGDNDVLSYRVHPVVRHADNHGANVVETEHVAVCAAA